jgi:hypothetical protein
MSKPSEQSHHDHKPSRYLAYLLRLWCPDHSQSASWRASLEDPHTGERIGFANLEELFAFLMEEVEGDGKRQSNPSKQKEDRDAKIQPSARN